MQINKTDAKEVFLKKNKISLNPGFAGGTADNVLMKNQFYILDCVAFVFCILDFFIIFNIVLLLDLPSLPSIVLRGNFTQTYNQF